MDQEDPPGRNLRTGVAVLLAAAVALLGMHALRGSQPPPPQATELAAQGSGLLELAVPKQQQHSQPQQQRADTAAAREVMIMNFAYSPATLTVNPGDTVTWTNMDTAPHNVVVSSGPEKFTSPTLQKGQTFSFTFTKPGTYSYYCSLHPDMKATITVTGSGGGDPPGEQPCQAFNKTVDAFLQHFYAAHLQRGPLDQVLDIVDLNQYVKTHTVLIQDMIQPQIEALLGGSTAALSVFLAHLYAAHLERSPTEQVADIVALDRYVKTHTVMVADMIKPFLDAELGGC
jgi:amicyanin